MNPKFELALWSGLVLALGLVLGLNLGLVLGLGQCCKTELSKNLFRFAGVSGASQVRSDGKLDQRPDFVLTGGVCFRRMFGGDYSGNKCSSLVRSVLIFRLSSHVVALTHYDLAHITICRTESRICAGDL